MRNLQKLMIAAPLLLALASCETATSLTVDESNPPTFRLAGSGHLFAFHVHGPLPEKAGEKRSQYLWQITGIEGHEIPTVGNLKAITYGKVPDGFKQEQPPNGEVPALVEGNTYVAVAVTGGANSGRLYFTIRDGRLVEVSAESVK